MVALARVIEANRAFTASHQSGKVCVFLGATAGIGLATLQRLYMMLDDSTFYLLGRNQSRHTARLEEIRSTKKDNRLVWVETQAALIQSIDASSRTILDSETKVDILCLSPKGMPFEGHVPSKEGLDTCIAVSYHARIRLILNLLPLLRKVDKPRVLSILAGTMERSIDINDLGCKKNWSMVSSMSQSITMTSLSFDRLARENDKMVWIQNTPGTVHTGSPRGGPSTKDGYLRYAALSVAHAGVGGMMWALGDSLEETGERHAYALTMDLGAGSIRMDRRNEVCPANSALKAYQNDEMYERIWEHTKGAWEEALAGEDGVDANEG